MTGQNASFSNYPNGFAGGLILDGLATHKTHTGKVFHVGDGDTAGNTPVIPNRKTPSDGNKGGFLDPYKTLLYAVEQCVDGRGDVIVVLPGYVESIEAAIDIEAGNVTILGLGAGDDRPQITPGIIDAFDVEGDNVTIQNMYFNETDAERTAGSGCFDVVGNGFRFLGNHVDLGAHDDVVITMAASKNHVITGNKFVVTADGTEAILDTEGIVDGLVWDDNTVISSVAALDEGFIDMEAIASTNTYIGATNNFGGSTVLVGSAHVGTQFGTSGGLRTTFGGATADEAETVIADVTGTVEIWGIYGSVETAVNSESDVGVEADGNAIDLVVSAEGIGDELTAVRDIIYTTTGGGTALELQASADLTDAAPGMWPAPVAVTAGEIVVQQTGTGGAGVFDWVIYWTPGPNGGNVADE